MANDDVNIHVEYLAMSHQSTLTETLSTHYSIATLGACIKI